MQLYDPARRRVNDKPELLGRRFVVPRLSIFPSEDSSLVQISAMIPDDRGGKFNSRQVLRTISSSKLPELLTAYYGDPEATLETLFEITLAPIAEPSDRELAKDLSASRSAPPQRPPRLSLDAAIASIEL